MSWAMWFATVVMGFVFLLLSGGLLYVCIDKTLDGLVGLVEHYLDYKKKLFAQLEEELGENRTVGKFPSN